MASQITAVVILSDGAHLVVNNRGAPWEIFRRSVLGHLVESLTASTQPGCSVLAMTVAHHDHFHEVTGQKEVFQVLSARTEMRYEA